MQWQPQSLAQVHQQRKACYRFLTHSRLLLGLKGYPGRNVIYILKMMPAQTIVAAIAARPHEQEQDSSVLRSSSFLCQTNKYSKLNKNEIRLCTFADDDETGVRCRLTATQLDTASEYKCLSYV